MRSRRLYCMQNHTKKKIKRRTFILLFLFWFCRVCLTEHKSLNARSNFSLPLLPVDLWLFFSLHYTFYFHIMHGYFFLFGSSALFFSSCSSHICITFTRLFVIFVAKCFFRAYSLLLLFCLVLLDIYTYNNSKKNKEI